MGTLRIVLPALFEGETIESVQKSYEDDQTILAMMLGTIIVGAPFIFPLLLIGKVLNYSLPLLLRISGIKSKDQK